MMSKKHYYYVTLELSKPTEQGMHTDFETLLDDLLDAADFMNNAYQGVRCMLIMQVHDLELHLLLLSQSSMQDQDIRDELRVFSNFLIEERGWNRISSDPLLFSLNADGIVEFGAWQAQLALFDSGHDLSQLDEWFDPIFDEDEPSPDDDQYGAVENGFTENTINDEQMLSTLRFIVDVQDLGSQDSVARKKSIIEAVKSMLSPWTQL